MNHEPQTSGFRLKIDFAQSSDPGRDPNKQVNEDSCGYAETRFGHLAVLCDGMGGHYGGKEASRTAITTIFEMFEGMPLTTPPAQALKAAIEEAGRRVYLLGGPPENRTRPGSTVVAMLLHERGLDVAHVGDSRAYIIRSNQIYPLTRDHSMVQGMIDAGMLTEESAMGHPDSNKITRALGMRPDVDVELRPESMELYAGDLLLQSSDGLTDLALGRDILGATRQALSSGGVEHACRMLVKMANDRGGHDNITVQLLRVMEVGAKSTTIPERPAAAHPATAPMQAPMQAQPYAPTAHGATTPDSGRGQAPSYGGAQQAANGGAWAAPQAMPAHHAGGASGAVAPTPPDYEGAQRPTLNDQVAAGPAAPQSMAGPGWSAQQYPAQSAAPQAAPAQAGLGPYRDGAPGALPLPPPSTRPAAYPPSGSPGVAPTAGMQAYTPTPMQGPPYTPQPPGAGPTPWASPPQYGMQGVPASRGGIVFVILGLSGVIAILILVVVWALWLRG
jgi:protein phosphatase